MNRSLEALVVSAAVVVLITGCGNAHGTAPSPDTNVATAEQTPVGPADDDPTTIEGAKELDGAPASGSAVEGVDYTYFVPAGWSGTPNGDNGGFPDQVTRIGMDTAASAPAAQFTSNVNITLERTEDSLRDVTDKFAETVNGQEGQPVLVDGVPATRVVLDPDPYGNQQTVFTMRRGDFAYSVGFFIAGSDSAADIIGGVLNSWSWSN